MAACDRGPGRLSTPVIDEKELQRGGLGLPPGRAGRRGHRHSSRCRRRCTCRSSAPAAWSACWCCASPDLGRFQDPSQRHLLETFAGQVGVALERVTLAERTQQARLEIEAERLRTSLLSSLSHDLRTPLGVITGAASSLRERGRPDAAEARGELLDSILEESQRMNRLIRNLLDMIRLETGSLAGTEGMAAAGGSDRRGADPAGRAAARITRSRSTSRPTCRWSRSMRCCWSRSSSTCWRTPPSTRPPARRSRSPPVPDPASSRERRRSRPRYSPRRGRARSSRSSIAAAGPNPARASAWVSPSPAASSSRTADGSGPRTGGAGEPSSGLPCR